MKQATLKIKVLLGLFVFLSLLAPAQGWASTVKMKVTLINPSQTKTQMTKVKAYLPKEIAPKHVVESGGLDVIYDETKDLFFVSKEVQLSPAETKVFEIILDDVWTIPTDKMDPMKERADQILGMLKDSSFYEQADVLVKSIKGRLDEIETTQGDQNVTRQQHVGYYRDNLKTMDSVIADMDRLEKILTKAGGPPNLDLIEKSDANLKSPTTKTTWIVIFIILIFIAILGAAFFFTWQGQTKVTENIFTREKESSFSEFGKKTPPPGDAGGKAP